MQVVLQYELRALMLTVMDDGRGFATDTAAGSGGFGMRGMQERAGKVGGVLEYGSDFGRGAKMMFRLALDSAAKETRA